MVMIDVLKNHATEIGQQTMLVYEGNETTYAEFYEQAKSIAGYLQSKSFQKDEIIAILMDNSDQFPIVYFAIQMAGYIAMPINTKLATPEIAYIIDNSNAKAIIFDEYLEQLIEPIQHPFQLKLKTTELAQLSTAQLNYTEPEIHADDVAVVMYTSGTTGKSKGVMLTHGNIYETARNWSAPMELTSKDRLFICTP
ncbi:MAG TPA: class I adenylate-forming enzyme family protein, partial [Kurthia sp.]